VPTQPTDSAKKASSNNLNHHIAQYSLAAAVAGVGMLALGAPATGEVVVTRKTINIPMASFRDFTTKISMANNGVNNFSFNLYSFEGFDRGLIMQGASAGDGVLASGFYAKAFALPRGAKIGAPASLFDPYTALIEATESGYKGSRSARGDWGGNPENRYLGIRFKLNGQTHYGWIRVSVTFSLQPNGPLPTAKITGYAYETVANKAIKAGTAAIAASAVEKPTAEVQVPKNIQNQSGPALGMLALGAEALPMWRREEALTLK
jgi:hypothetical protein